MVHLPSLSHFTTISAIVLPCNPSDQLHPIYEQSNTDPAIFRYVEAHGPGNPVGDPIEAGALGKEIGQARYKDERSLREQLQLEYANYFEATCEDILIHHIE